MQDAKCKEARSKVQDSKCKRQEAKVQDAKCKMQSAKSKRHVAPGFYNLSNKIVRSELPKWYILEYNFPNGEKTQSLISWISRSSQHTIYETIINNLRALNMVRARSGMTDCEP